MNQSKNYDQEMVENVIKVSIGIWNPQDILNGSVCEVMTCETYENGRPKVNGLFDLRMGTIEKAFMCETCHQDYLGCPGHFGHINLVRPVYYTHFMKYMLKIARCFCYVCSECLVPIDKPEEYEKIKTKPMKSRFQYIFKEYKDSSHFKTCGKCNTIQPTKFINPRNSQDSSNGIAKVFAEFSQTNGPTIKQYISCEEMLQFLKNIKNDDLDKIGIPSKESRPDWMICNVYPVPPPHVRPSVRQENNQKSEDDLTHKLAEIITRNQTLRDMLKSNSLSQSNMSSSNLPGSSMSISSNIGGGANGLVESLGNSKVNSASEIIDGWTQVLQFHVSTIIDNEIPGIPRAIQRSGRPIKALKQRLQSKDGRMRLNLMGKRGDFTARTVITAEPNISLDELGVPKKIAMNLTFPEIVNEWNMERLRKNVENGTTIYPGAKSIVKKRKRENGNIIYQQYTLSIKGSKKGCWASQIEIGDTVHRHLRDGDLVFFNRQPSLHKMSMMGHKVRVLDVGNTFRLNVSATAPYNADFDGDEMNVFLTQCMEGVVELKYLTLVENQIISPQRNQCVIGLFQDTLFACSQITDQSVHISKSNFMNLMMFINQEKSPLPPQDEWTGRRLFDMIIPKITLKRNTIIGKVKSLAVDPSQKELVEEQYELNIINGKIQDGKGIVDKNTVGTSAGGIIHILWNDYNPKTSSDFIFRCQKLCTQWLLNVGHSVGVSDCLFLKDDMSKMSEVYDGIHDVIQRACSSVMDILNLAKQGRFERKTPKPIVDEVESDVMEILQKAKNDAAKVGITDYLIQENEGNRLMKMILAGSKGDTMNVAQIMCVFGQADVAGTRAPLFFQHRALPHYAKFDNSPEARGFAAHSFKEGLEPNEFYFLASSTRIGLIDKTVKTADTGYTQRRLIKSMEDLMVSFDGTVRTANNSILQFGYGDDFFDATFLEKLNFKYHLLTDAEFKDKFERYCERDEYLELEAQRMRIKAEMGYNTEFYTPVNIQRILEEIINTTPQGNEEGATPQGNEEGATPQGNEEGATPQGNEEGAGGVSAVHLNQSSGRQSYFYEMRKNFDSFLREYFKKSSNEELPRELFMFRNYYMFELTKAVLGHKKATKKHMDKLLRKMRDSYVMAICSSGEMVGILCGQSIGEPTTQMTLNKFHHIGSSVRNTTTGVPRMKELLAVSKKIKTPVMTLFLENNFSNMDESLIKIKILDYSKIFVFTKISDILDKVDVFFETSLDFTNSVFPSDNPHLKKFVEHENDLRQLLGQDDFKPPQPNSCVFRLKFDKLKFLVENISDKMILTSIKQAFENISSMSSNKAYNFQFDELVNFETTEQDGKDGQDRKDRKFLIVRAYFRINVNKNGERDIEGLGINYWQIIQKILDKFILVSRIKGIDGISSTALETIKYPDGRSEIAIMCSGSKLKEVLMFDDVRAVKLNTGQTVFFSLDKRRIKSNDVNEMYDVFGIEVARNSLIEEFTAVLEDTGGVNMRHITILVDTMTSKGQLIPIDRHGVKKNEIGPLSRATFEETVDQLLKAATFGESDHMNGVSANIMMGQMAPCGTGTVHLLLDESRILSDKMSNGTEISKEKTYQGSKYVNSDHIHTVENIIEKISVNSSKLTKRKRVFEIQDESIVWLGNVVRQRIHVNENA
jgi:DNA-directed RNA polymerase II subunit RPB1